MAELAFPTAAVAMVFFVLIPALTALSVRTLAWRRRTTTQWADFGSEVTFAWLVAPTLLPVLWLTSSAFGQASVGPLGGPEVCLTEGVLGTDCWDTTLLLGLLIAGIGGAVGLRIWRDRPRVQALWCAPSEPVSRTLSRLVSADPRLRRLTLRVGRRLASPVFTMGWFRPVTVMDACFVRDADDAMVVAALLHERAHSWRYDTLRASLVRLCLAANPAAKWLRADFDRWRHAREAQCDSEAVHAGGEALALAQGITYAARFRCSARGGVSLLCGHDLAALKLRVALLLDGPPRPRRTLGHAVLVLAVLAALVAPHVQGGGFIEHFHFEVERLLHAI